MLDSYKTILICWCVTCTECHSCSTQCLNNPQDSLCLNVLLHLLMGQCQLCFLSPIVFCAFIKSLRTRWGCILSCVSDKQTSCPCKHYCICAVCMHVSRKDKGSDHLNNWHQLHNNIGYLTDGQLEWWGSHIRAYQRKTHVWFYWTAQLLSSHTTCSI